MSDTRKRILMFSEAVTLAHVARPLAFAQGLRSDEYEVAVAAAQHALPHVKATGARHIPLHSVSPEAFLRALSAGRPLYDAATLVAYVDDDLRIIREFDPDLVVGDFRLSLSVSARLANVPYVSIASAYWSPFYEPERWPVPALPLTRLLPLPIAQGVFSIVRPLAFKLHCAPLNAVRRRFGLQPLQRDLRLVYTDADFVLYSDLAELFPTRGLPAQHRFLGPVLWQPAVALPSWWDNLPSDKPIVYVTLGSSGNAALLPKIVEALSALAVTVIVATAGVSETLQSRPNVFTAPFLPGRRAAERSRLVVCNGGNLTGYQALAAGVPVIGIPSNLDQFLNVQGIERAGAGVSLRADRFAPSELEACVESLMRSAEKSAAARRVMSMCKAQDFETSAESFVRTALAERRAGH